MGEWWPTSIALCYSASLSFTHLMWLSKAVSNFAWGSLEARKESIVNCQPVTVLVKVFQNSFFVTLRKASTHRNHELAKTMNTVFNMFTSALSSISLVL